MQVSVLQELNGGGVSESAFVLATWQTFHFKSQEHWMVVKSQSKSLNVYDNYGQSLPLRRFLAYCCIHKSSCPFQFPYIWHLKNAVLQD